MYYYIYRNCSNPGVLKVGYVLLGIINTHLRVYLK